MRSIFIFLLSLFFSASVASAGSRVALKSDIATGWGNGAIWLKSMENGYKPYGHKIVSRTDGHPVRLGNKSIRFEVRPGDCGNNGGWNDCKNDRERHELSQKKNLQRHGQENWFAWSIFVPTDTPAIMPTHVHLGQFHQKKKNVLWLMSWSYSGYQIDNQVPGNGYTQAIETIVKKDDFKGRWIDILIHVKWSHDIDGFFRVYANHQQRYEWKGQTIAKGDQSNFKFGIYRSFVSRYKMAEDAKEVPKQVVYYDELHKANSLAGADKVGVAKLQTILAEKGHYQGAIDGLWGKNSLNATNAMLAEMGAEAIKSYSLDLWKHFEGK